MSKSILAIIAALFIVSCAQHKEDNEASKQLISSNEELIKRGKYLTTVGACHDCHSPKIMTDRGPQIDTTRIFSGHRMDEPVPAVTKTNDWILFSNGLTAFVGPWGISFSANLTPDETGIGNWSFEQFKNALRNGKSKGLQNNRPLLPPMPWEMYRNYSDEDIKAVFTYLKSIPPVHNIVPAPIPPNRVDNIAKTSY